MTSFFSEIIALVLCCCLSSCHILRLPCKEVGEFSVIKENFALPGHVIATFPSLTVAECEHKCLLNNQCNSINTEKGDQTCELNSKAIIHLSTGENALVAKQNWIYKSTNYSETLNGENCNFFKPCKAGKVCMDTCECTGYRCIPGLKGCKEARDLGYKASGVYKISSNEFPSQWLSVYCDMATDGNGWIVFQRRIDNAVSFDRTWSEYRKRFGVITGNYWLGLDNLHILAAPGKGAVLRVDLRHRDDTNKVYAYYSTFEIGNEADGYRLKIGGYAGTAGDGLALHNNMKFTTKDRDNDAYIPQNAAYNCAVMFKGGWWFNACHEAHLNGLYPPSTPSNEPKTMSWLKLKNAHGNIMFSEMKLRYP